VTNAEYAAFVRDWTEAAVPLGGDRRGRAGGPPVVNVSWHEPRLRDVAAGRTNRGTGCRPKQMGEGGARDGRAVVALGNDWDPTKANTAESGPGRTTPVVSTQ